MVYDPASVTSRSVPGDFLPNLAESQARSAVAVSLAAIFLCGITIPSSIIIGRAALAGALGLIALTVAAAAWREARWTALASPTWGPLALAAVVVVGWLPSLPGSLMPLASVGTAARVAALVVGAALLWSFLAARSHLTPVLLKVFVAGMLVSGLFVLVATTLLPELVSFRSAAPPRPELQFKASASVFVCSFPVVLYAGWRLGGRWRWVAVACVILGLFAIAATHSRSALAGILIALCVAGLLAVTRRLPRLPALILWGLAVVAPVVVLVLLWQRPPTEWHGPYGIHLPDWLIDRHRQVIWQFVFDRFLEKPWLGWGINTINLTPGAGDHIPGINAEFVPSHAHSWLLQILSETGLVGFLPMLTVVVGVGIVAALAWARQPSFQRMAWLLLWCVFWMSSAFNFSFWAAWWQAAAVMLAVLVLAPMDDKA